MEEEKKLYWQLDYGEGKITMQLDGAFEWIKNDDCVDEDTEYILTPIWLTETEFDNLPEADI